MENSGYRKDGPYRSSGPPIVFPKDPNLSLVCFLFQNSDAYPDRLALADAVSGESSNFAQFKSLVQKLSKLDIKKGDVVLIFSPSSIYFPVRFLVIGALGAAATTVNPLYTSAESKKQVDDSKAKLVITVPQWWDKVKNPWLPAVFLARKISADGSIASSNCFTYYHDLVKLGEHVYEFPPVSIKQSDVAALHTLLVPLARARELS